MRDFIIVGIILGAAPACLFNPFFGVLMWSWIAYMNPHRFTWGFAYNFPVALVIAIPTLAGTLFTRQTNRRFVTREFALLLTFWVWMCITFYHASQTPVLSDHQIDAQADLVIISKVLLMTFLTILLTTTKERLRYLILVTALSFGVLAIKGGIFGLASGGHYRVFGPPDSFIGDNNDFGLAMNMALPMLFFLGRDEKNKTLRMVLRFATLLGVVAILLTYSRGALIGLGVVLAAIAVKTRHKMLAGFSLALLALMVVSFAPPAWSDRMGNLFAGNLDQSAEQRLASWGFAWNLAKEFPITGGGVETFTPQLFSRYSTTEMPGGFASSGPHSIYFQVLGEQGFVGLGLFLALLMSCWFSLRKLRRLSRKQPVLEWMEPYTHMFEIGLLGFMVSGAFLGRAYFDLFFQLVATTVILRVLCRQEIESLAHEIGEDEAQPELLTRTPQAALPG